MIYCDRSTFEKLLQKLGPATPAAVGGLFPSERVADAMSAIGTKRTYRVAPHMSAFGGKADIPFCAANARF
jgi:hypothetical protein